MTMMTAEQMIAAQKANLETLFGLTEKAFAGVEKMVELNMAAAKAAIADTQSQTHAAMNVKDVQELMALQAGYLQPLSEKAVAFSRHVYEIASSTSKDFAEAVEVKAAEAQKSVHGLVDSVSKNAPAGSESAMAMMKTAMAASQTAIESVQKAVKQATEAAEANLQALATTSVSTATAKPASRKR
ncbi:MAG: phasin family protein [Betaproteobacteria bacterium]|jgi:phasin family protein|nr:phasin family protein [Betaproteobacteria bacterium]